MLSSLKGPFIADGTTQLPFTPASVYRNDKVSGSAELNQYDVYYYSESLQDRLDLYPPRGRPHHGGVSQRPAPPPRSPWQARTYTLGSTAVASQVSSLNGGGVGQVVTLLLGMNNEAAGIVTGEEADERLLWRGASPSARNLIDEDNGADVLQNVKVPVHRRHRPRP